MHIADYMDQNDWDKLDKWSIEEIDDQLELASVVFNSYVEDWWTNDMYPELSQKALDWFSNIATDIDDESVMSAMREIVENYLEACSERAGGGA